MKTLRKLIKFLKSTPSWGPAEMMSSELKPNRGPMCREYTGAEKGLADWRRMMVKNYG